MSEQIRRAKWLALYCWSFFWGIVAYMVLFFLTPLTGAWPKSPRNIHYTAWKHATWGYGDRSGAQEQG